MHDGVILGYNNIILKNMCAGTTQPITQYKSSRWDLHVPALIFKAHSTSHCCLLREIGTRREILFVQVHSSLFGLDISGLHVGGQFMWTAYGITTEPSKIKKALLNWRFCYYSWYVQAVKINVFSATIYLVIEDNTFVDYLHSIEFRYQGPLNESLLSEYGH